MIGSNSVEEIKLKVSKNSRSAIALLNLLDLKEKSELTVVFFEDLIEERIGRLVGSWLVGSVQSEVRSVEIEEFRVLLFDSSCWTGEKKRELKKN